MKKNLTYHLLIVPLFLLASCSMGQLESMAEKMGKNVAGGTTTTTIETNAGKTSASSIAKDNASLGSIITAMKKGDSSEEEVDLESVVLVTPLESSTIDSLKMNYSSDDGKELLETYKTLAADDLSEEDKEGIKGTAELLSGFIGNVDTSAIEDEETKKLVESIVDSVVQIANTDFDTENDDTYNVTKGDVIALQYTVSLLEEVSNAIPEEGITITKDSKDIKVTGTDVINALFGNESANTESGFTMSDISSMLDTTEGTEVASELIKSVESYLNIVSAVSNMTGGVDTASLISSYLAKT